MRLFKPCFFSQPFVFFFSQVIYQENEVGYDSSGRRNPEFSKQLFEAICIFLEEFDWFRRFWAPSWWWAGPALATGTTRTCLRAPNYLCYRGSELIKGGGGGTDSRSVCQKTVTCLHKELPENGNRFTA